MEIKQSFLDTIDWIEHAKTKELNNLILYIFTCLAKQQESKQLALAMPINLSIQQITQLIEAHCSYKYIGRGGSRLPVLALYSIYQIIVNEFERYQGQTLLPLESHLSADTRSKLGGDINVVDDAGKIVEAVEVKMGISITGNSIVALREKLITMRMQRYYILSTVPCEADESVKINALLHQIRTTNGCQVIVNGVIKTLSYYLRLIKSPALFVETYVANLISDNDVHFEFKEVWNKLVSEFTV